MHPIKKRRTVAESIVDNNVMFIDTLPPAAAIKGGGRGGE
jgi:hypothetical protein